MDSFSPRQYHDLSHVLKTSRLADYCYSWRHRASNSLKLATWQPSRQLASELAFSAIGVLNLSSYAKLLSFSFADVQQAASRYKTLVVENASDLSKIPCKRCFIQQNIDIPRAQKHVEAYINLVALSRNSPIWTWITSNFVHMLPVHLFGNMTALWLFGYSCIRNIPTLSPRHIGAVTIGSSIFSSIAQLTHWHWIDAPVSQKSIGASAICLAFGPIAAATEAEPGTQRSFWRTGLVYGLMGAQLIFDVLGLVRLARVPAMPLVPGQTQPGHVAHLAGMVFGVWNYYTFLRPILDQVAVKKKTLQLDGDSIET